ncbi:protein phosphatase 2C domain-containing protein [Moraxella osloensis]|uniref:protein phosphatase 2C domain-containing protein n=1 Tax=Faucicola osloensis TaxID=34062 RepID=UPI00243302B7|nr:protein phosphatase 2C domain-containing protein [Moraxella osloensis]
MNQTTDLFAQTSHSSVQSSWQVYGASSIGKSHIDSNLPNQDSIYLQKTEHGMVAVVCDGAGSAKFSQAGAAFFSQSIAQMLLSLGVSHRGIALDLGQLKQQIIEQLSQIRLDLQSQLPAESSLRDYHTTFTGLLIHSNHQAILVQIGDSPLITSQFVVRHPHIDYFTNLQVYGDDSKNEYVNETHFITQDNWQSFLRVEPIDLSQVDCLALMSDGCADLVFEGASVTPKIYRPFFGNLLFNLTQSQSSQQGSAIIEQALGNPATYRLTGDDKSLVVLLKKQQHYQNLEPMVEGQNEALANETLENDTIATAPNNPTVWHTDAVNHKNTRATSTPDGVVFNDITSNNINNIALTPNPHSANVVTDPATPAATTSQVLPPSQSVSDATRQRRNTAMMAGAAMLIGTGILGWINKDRLLPTQTVSNANTAASVASTTPTSAITPPLTAHALGDSYAIDLSKVATVTESGNPSDDPILKVIIASPQGGSIDAIEQKSKPTSSAKTKNDNKNSVNQPLLSATVTTVVANKNPTVARVSSGAASTALQNQHTDATLGATLTDSQFNNHAVKLAAKASCLPVTDTHDLISLGVTIQPTMHYYNCQISLPIKSMTSQIAGLSKKTEILDSLTLDKGLAEILTSSTTNTAATASTGLPASTVSDSSDNQQIQLYYLGVTDPVNHMSAAASTDLAALPASSAHLKR